MKISLFTGRFKDPQRKSRVREASEVSAEHGAQLLVLPGYSLGPGQDDPDAIQQFADATGVYILAEAHNTYCFRPNQEPVGPFVQRFSTGANAKHDKVQRVAEEFANGKRLLEVGDKTVGVLLCGENNFLTNVRKNANEPQPRHPDIGWPFVYDVLVNPAHTSMGQWNLLHKRFAYFSRSERTLLYCTNNTHRSWRTGLCVYRDGKEVVMGDLATTRGLQTHPSKGWRLVTVEIV